ncbi:MAG: YheT family hydrolase [Limnohabitans sp.]|jgi:predicted alpha/beta-fold hydrolase|uniref:YheT family hydrolase n=1 Tax=Limnohabitans sp. TaxID=1907725 RepID=UPI003919AB71
MDYKAPAWLPGGHAQTIWSALYAQKRHQAPVPMHRERWTTPDGDFIDVDKQMASSKKRPLLVLFHGLEGSSDSHYAQAFADWAHEHDVQLAIPHFRGCSGQINLSPRAYHSGDHEEIDWVLKRLRQVHRAQQGEWLLAVGVSLGGNALMRWAAEQGQEATKTADAIASICSPLDLAMSGDAIGKGLNRYIYTPMFLKSMKPKALAKWAQFPGLFDKDAMLNAKDLYEFDNVFTAPLHGFKNTLDYWAKASAKPLMQAIHLPALVLNAQNDPFVPASSLPQHKDVSRSVTLWQPEQGGHVGFAAGPWPGHVRQMPNKVGEWLMKLVREATPMKGAPGG